MADSILSGLTEAVRKGLGKQALGTTRAKALAATDDIKELGVDVVGVHSPDDELEDFEQKLWDDQNDFIEWQSREWLQHLFYVSGIQLIAYHTGFRRWLSRKTLPWRIRSVYNVCQKAVQVRVSRLTENKPTVSVQAGTADREDIEKAELKETLFWDLWERLGLHLKVIRARRWACKAASGFLHVGWDADAGRRWPRTEKRLKVTTVQTGEVGADGQVVSDPATGQPVQHTAPTSAGVEEVYLNAKGEPVLVDGQPVPTEHEEDDPEFPGQQILRPTPPPPGTDFYYDGEAFVDVRSPFNVRWDRYTDDLPDSWYVQDAEVLPATAIVALFPDATDKLKDAKAASEQDRALSWQGLTARPFGMEMDAGTVTPASEKGTKGGPQTLDRDYLVRATMIFPKNGLLRKLWGEQGRYLVTVGGKLVMNTELPQWALEACPYVQFLDIPEEGNHYGKSFLRDLVPLQDDINRTRSHKAERLMILSRIIFTAPKNHQVNLSTLAGMPGVLLTHRDGAKPEQMQLQGTEDGSSEFYNDSLSAAQDLGMMNDASSGRLPSAGIAAKTVYALQYAEERTISEVSNLQDIALQRLAKALDAVTRREYQEDRKIRLIGRDRAFMAERTVHPADLEVDVDYHFVPGSMLSRQKEAVKNELLTLKDAGLLQPWEVKKFFASAVPDAFRQSYDVQEAHARRTLTAILDGNPPKSPHPWEDPQVHVAVLEEFMVTSRWDTLEGTEQQGLMQLWQAYKTMLAPPPAAGTPPAAGGAPGPPGAPAPGAPAAAAVQAGPAQLEAAAKVAEAPPKGFGAPAAAA